MVEFAILAFLLGAVLSLQFRVMALVPAIPFMLAIVAIGGAFRGETILWIGVAMVLVATSVQMGYLGGGLGQGHRGH